jgi:hypothetical protein
MTQFKNDYRLSPAESARIKCSGYEECGAQATTGQNNGGAPFWYHCDECAEVGRRTGNFYGMTGEDALAKVKAIGGNLAVYHPETNIGKEHYRVAKINEIGFEWEGIGRTWKQAFVNIQGREVTA